MADESEDVREVMATRMSSLIVRKRLTSRGQRLKAALWFAVGKMVDEESMRRDRNATPQFIGALTDMVWTQIGKAHRLGVWNQLPNFAGCIRKHSD